MSARERMDRKAEEMKPYMASTSRRRSFATLRYTLSRLGANLAFLRRSRTRRFVARLIGRHASSREHRA